ncbi:phosphoadenylylsulfate reductase (thioredoxin) [Arthrobacter crystallopoietes BAB-32]|uniref:Adenosine 5'-phosphosulfate reductase n=1 Tax=Arthrobacter crystallopoietes BAB-32 TaxID=1246476 RepID=N1UY13_9MICC|nr:phosphoadenylyl-sulfate reductase [Arthrobacter crystallopoietes]EMY35266.1 phosphoadenylylsulfate reductase (thioredoxin) [Arthrobacter crystallopoietes BAB-32]
MSLDNKQVARPARSTEETQALKELAAAGAEKLGWDAPAEQVVAWVRENFGLREAAVACSMADAALPHLVAEQLPGVDVLFLETGYHFTETHATRTEVARALDVRIVDVLPDQTVAEQDEAHGPELFSRDPALCCQLRKMDPLRKALARYKVWFTGVRRDEAPTRTNTPLVAWDEAHGLVKVNPVAPWSFEDLTGYAARHAVPLNLLLQQGYPSIGCRPCTRPVAPGEDPRAGRWAGLAKTECGIHA